MSKIRSKLAKPGLLLNDKQKRFLEKAVKKPGSRRNEIADELGFSQQTAMRAVLPLVEAGILIEVDELTAGRGKPPRLVHFAKSSLLTTAFVIAREQITVSICDLQGSVIVRETERRLFETCREQLDTIAELHKSVLSNVPPSAIMVSAAATATGFFLESGQKLISRVDPLGYSKVNLRDWLQELTGVEVIIENDARVVAADILDTSPYLDFLVVFLDYGIGGAIVQNGQIVRGKHGNAGAIGRLFPHDSARPTSQSLRAELGVDDWRFWRSSSQLSSKQSQALEAWFDSASYRFNYALTAALALLDFEAVYICSQIPEEYLQELTKRIHIEPLGANIPLKEGAMVDFTLDTPVPIGRAIGDMAKMTHALARNNFLDIDKAEN